MRTPQGQAWLGTAVALLAIAVTALIDIWTGPMAVLVGLTVIGPLIASLRSTIGQTVFVSATALVTSLLLGIPNESFLTRDHLIRVAIVALASALCVRLVWERSRREDVAKRLAEVAEVAQEAILRPPPAELADVRLAARYVSASEESQVGGDLYETAYTPTGVRVIIGDVRGKGLDAVKVAAAVLGAFREVVWDRSLVNVARALDERIAKISSDEEEFATALLVELIDDNRIALVNCGHHPPLRLRGGEAEFLDRGETTLPLGLGPEPVLIEYGFEPGDRLLLYTDGLVEARNAAGEFFPLMAHRDALLAPTPQEGVDALLGRLLEHLPGRSSDDVAVLLLERKSTPSSPYAAA